ncbi:alpha/beta hydrolase [Gleimia hominis]|uniref:alpha/beta hydrolase n=1 Tax=Gleimia hominis TaxID=595468 RepID=UPI000C801DDA|nr:alpha/beta hydrolase [Gleimia hominis]WIK64378.1 alpha/beta hydrolase [Gleimia hominis]
MNKRIVAILATALLVAGCSAGGSAEESKNGAHSEKSSDPKLQVFYDQEVKWGSCDGDAQVAEISQNRLQGKQYQCANVKVPVDYQKPEGPSVQLRVARFSQDGSHNRTPLVYNPGGPGGSAIGGLASMVESVFSKDVLGKYDLVAPDPRGVGLSAPVKCLTPEQTDKMRASDESSLDKIRSTMAKMGKQCLEESEQMTRHADTDSVVKDLDVLRAAMRQKKLNYVGFSYGTLVGIKYADAFGKNVGRMVLDGALDPAANVNEISQGQAEGFEASVDHWIELATKNGELPDQLPRGQAKTMIRTWLDQLESKPLPTADPNRPLTKSLAMSAILAGMYSTDSYKYVTQGVMQAMGSKDGSILLQIADLYADRKPDGSYSSNSFDAFNVVNALDYKPVGTPKEWEKTAEELKKKLPFVGSEFSYASAGLVDWPVKAPGERKALSASEAPEFLIVGTKNDPATPYKWAVNMHEAAAKSRLVSWNGWGHCAYRQDGSAGVRSTVDKYLIDGKVPEEDVSFDD